MNFIVLSSSRGTTFQSVIENMNNESLTATCLGLITDSEDRECIQKAKDSEIPYRIVNADPKEDRHAFDKNIETLIIELSQKSEAIENVIIAEMGWMWIHTPWFINRHAGKIINVHPALLPKFGGEGMYGHHVHDAVLEACEKESGMTIHVMDEGVDTGKILLQKTCSVMTDDTAETLQAYVQELEKEWYPKCLEMIERGEIVL